MEVEETEENLYMLLISEPEAPSLLSPQRYFITLQVFVVYRQHHLNNA